MNREMQVGQLVCSTKGRDSGRFYLIVGIISDGFVQIADGQAHRLEAPKRKNIKHLRLYLPCAENIKSKIETGQRVTNPEVKKAIENLVREIGGSQEKVRN